MNGIVVSEFVSPKPESYSNVKVYAAGKYVQPSNAWIRNLQASTSRFDKVTTSSVVTASIDVQTLPTVTQTLIHGNGKKVKENSLIGTFANWWPTYKIRFEVKVDSFGSKPGFLLLFTAKNGYCRIVGRFSCSSGQYIPAIFTGK